MMRYISNEYTPTSFSGKDSKDKAYLDMVLSTAQDIKNAASNQFYSTGDREAITKMAFERLPALEKFLGDNQYIIGDYVTFLDFFIWELIELFTFASNGEILVRLPKLAEYHKRVAALPKFSEYLKSDRFMVRPFNNKIAKLNN